MKILVVAATTFELGPFMESPQSTDFLITGVGIPATVYSLTRKLLSEKYDLVIQAGIAGAFDNALLENVVTVERDTFADAGILENYKLHLLHEVGLAEKHAFPFKNGWLVNEQVPPGTEHLQRVDAITVNTINSDEKFTSMMQQKFKAAIESMEGAALHYVCLLQKVQFLQLRSISNIVGDRNKNNWKIDAAIENLNIQLTNLVNAINKP